MDTSATRIHPSGIGPLRGLVRIADMSRRDWSKQHKLTTMKRLLYLILALFISMTSCLPFRTLNSTTYIKANDAFILGDNEHGRFNVTVTNTSIAPVDIWQYPLSGERHSLVTLRPTEEIKLKVEENTSIRIENSSSEQVAVRLRVKGDTGLSMNYREK